MAQTKQSTFVDDEAKHQVSGSPDTTLIGDTATREHHDAVSFTTPGRVVEALYDDPIEDLRLLSSIRPSVEEDHTIETILSRPIKIAKTKWTTQASRGALLGTFDIATLLQSDNLRIVRQKLSGFYGIHASVVLKVLVNPQPFQSGLFHVFYIPFQKTFTMFPATLNGTELSLPFATGCPNVYCNISLQSQVELSVPYTGPQAFFNLADIKYRDWGTFYIQNISSIRDGTNQTSAELSVYISFSNVKLFGATPQTWSTQGERDEGDVKISKSNPIAQSLGLAANAFVTQGTTKLLDLVGLSKPAANQNPQRVLVSPYANPVLGDSVSAALKLSFQESQGTSIGQLGIDSQDEMDIAYVVSKPNYYCSVEWKDSQETGTLLKTIRVNPNAEVVTSGSNVFVAPTRLRYVASMFRFWRGTIRYTFHVVATKFHSGRLRLVYSLGGSLSDSIGVQFPYAYSQVIDLRDGLTFAVELPYFGSTPWRSVPKFWDSNQKIYVDDDRSNADDYDNYLQIFVENQLANQTTASAAIELIIMASGGSDFEVAAPSAMVGYPTQIETNISGKSAGTATNNNDVTQQETLDSIEELNLTDEIIPAPRRAVRSPFMMLQGEVESVEECDTHGRLLGGRKICEVGLKGKEPLVTRMVNVQGEVLDIPVLTLVSKETRAPVSPFPASTLTMGERIKNLRVLIRRYFPVASVAAYPKDNILLFPYVVGEPFIGGSRNTRSYEYLANIWPMYRFYRGGMRLLFASATEGIGTVKYDPYINPRIYKGATPQMCWGII